MTLATIDRKPMAAFKDHAAGCAKCAAVDIDKPATFAAACLVGSRTLKSGLNGLWHAYHGKRERARLRELRPDR